MAIMAGAFWQFGQKWEDRCDQHAADECAATYTWFAGTLVHAMAELKEPLAALGVDIV